MKLNPKIILTLVFISAPVFGDEPPRSEKQPPPAWSVGTGLVHISRAYRGLNSRTIPIPFISYRSQNFFIQGPKAGAQTWIFHIVGLGVQARYKFGGYEPDDDPFFTGMAERQDTFEAGGLLRLRLPGRILVSADYFRDTLNHHRGQAWNIGVRRRFSIQKITLIPSVGFEILSENNAHYYYGVSTEEGTTARPPYRLTGAGNWTTGLSVLYQFSEQWFSIISFSWVRLDSDIGGSPLVETRNKTRTIAGLTYKF